MKNFKQIAKWSFLAFLIVATIFILRNHSASMLSSVKYRDCAGNIFGTTYKVVYQHEQDLSTDIICVLNEVDASLSLFNQESTLVRINNHLTDTMDAMMQEVFMLSQQVSEATNGAFDCTVAPAVDAWGFGFKNREFITDAKIDSLKTLIGYRKVSMNEDGVIHRECDGLRMDFGAVAKGFGVDKVAEMLRSKGVENMMVEIGGEVVVAGVRADGNLWKIAVQNPKENGYNAVLSLSNKAMATSGNYFNCYVNEQGVRVAHTISPFTAKPVTHSLLSVTVMAPTCAIADAYATSFMVMGYEDARQILENHPELGAYFICAKGEEVETFAINFEVDGDF